MAFGDKSGLSNWLLEQIAKGQVILFLGAGSSMDAGSLSGTGGLSGDALRDHLCDVFLGGDHKKDPLKMVAEYCKHVAGIRKVAKELRATFEPLTPSSAHHLIPTFSWKAIFTTNYDLVVEAAFANADNPKARILPVCTDRELQGAPLCVNIQSNSS